jgi:Ca2+-dependent lipid-binding protein
MQGFPDPFAVATVNGEQTRTTGVIKKTLNPYWNESFDMYAEIYGTAGTIVHVTNGDAGESMRRAY